MFKKIRSNRDPRDTLYHEIRKEFLPYVQQTGVALRKAMERYPRSIFWTMTTAIVVSAAVSFKFQWQHDKAVIHPAQHMMPVSSGFDQIMRAARQLHKTIILKSRIDSLSTKGNLSHGDSLLLEKALDDFQKINNQINQRK